MRGTNEVNEVTGTNNVPEVPMPQDDIWVIYGAPWCKYCVKAKELLESKNIPHNYVDITDYGAINVQKQLSELTNDMQTIPIIFNGNNFIGGYSELLEIEISQ